jgi:hypothetical protein
VHALRAWIVPSRNELLGVFACEQILVIPLFEGAHDGRVPVFDVESTSEAHTPIVVYLIGVGEIRVAALLLDTGGGWELYYASPIWNQVGHRWGISSAAHGIRERHAAATTSASNSAATLTPTLTSTSRIENPHGCKRLLHWDGNLLDGRDTEWFAWNKGMGVLGWGRHE